MAKEGLSQTQLARRILMAAQLPLKSLGHLPAFDEGAITPSLGALAAG